eukprot:SAG22_NODE_124_length_18884_cov_34.149367_13_plen_116_part_00
MIMMHAHGPRGRAVAGPAGHWHGGHSSAAQWPLARRALQRSAVAGGACSLRWLGLVAVAVWPSGADRPGVRRRQQTVLDLDFHPGYKHTADTIASTAAGTVTAVVFTAAARQPAP